MPCVFPILALKASTWPNRVAMSARRDTMRSAMLQAPSSGRERSACIARDQGRRNRSPAGRSSSGPADDPAPAAADDRDHLEPASPVRVAGGAASACPAPASALARSLPLSPLPAPGRSSALHSARRFCCRLPALSWCCRARARDCHPILAHRLCPRFAQGFPGPGRGW